MSILGGYSSWIRSDPYSKMVDEEDAKIFAAITAAARPLPAIDWVAKLSIGDTVRLTDLNKWATVVSRWTSEDPLAVFGGVSNGRIQFAYDMATYEWSVTSDGRGMDGRVIMSKFTAVEKPMIVGAVRTSEVRNMVMVDVGREWKDVVTLLKDPMDVEGVGVGGAIWSAKGHSGDDDVSMELTYLTPSMDYTGKSGERLRVPARIALYLTLSTSTPSSHTWDIGSFVSMDDPVWVFKADDVMISLCENPLLVYEMNTWGILKD